MATSALSSSQRQGAKIFLLSRQFSRSAVASSSSSSSSSSSPSAGGVAHQKLLYTTKAVPQERVEAPPPTEVKR